MKKELDEKLCAKYPKIFVNRHGKKTETAMCWGFACGDGWYWLIDKLCSNLQWDTDKNNSHDQYPQVVASQVKEKFGTLRFYVESATSEQFSVIGFAESLSSDICEDCGTTENMGRTQGWLRNICYDCSKEQKNPWLKKEEE
jgi:hypothetical protein